MSARKRPPTEPSQSPAEMAKNMAALAVGLMRDKRRVARGATRKRRRNPAAPGADAQDLINLQSDLEHDFLMAE